MNIVFISVSQTEKPTQQVQCCLLGVPECILRHSFQAGLPVLFFSGEEVEGSIIVKWRHLQSSMNSLLGVGLLHSRRRLVEILNIVYSLFMVLGDLTVLQKG